MKTEVLNKDQQTIVVGGLIDESESEVVSKVPLLGDIPLLGYLFRSTSVEHKKRNLIMLLRPTIVQDNVDDVSVRKFEDVWQDSIIDGDKQGTMPSFDDLYQGRTRPITVTPEGLQP